MIVDGCGNQGSHFIDQHGQVTSDSMTHSCQRSGNSRLPLKVLMCMHYPSFQIQICRAVNQDFLKHILSHWEGLFQNFETESHNSDGNECMINELKGSEWTTKKSTLLYKMTISSTNQRTEAFPRNHSTLLDSQK